MEIATPVLVHRVHAGGVFRQQRRIDLVMRQVSERDAWADWPPRSPGRNSSDALVADQLARARRHTPSRAGASSGILLNFGSP